MHSARAGVKESNFRNSPKKTTPITKPQHPGANAKKVHDDNEPADHKHVRGMNKLCLRDYVHQSKVTSRCKGVAK